MGDDACVFQMPEDAEVARFGAIRSLRNAPHKTMLAESGPSWALNRRPNWQRKCRTSASISWLSLMTNPNAKSPY